MKHFINPCSKDQHIQVNFSHKQTCLIFIPDDQPADWSRQGLFEVRSVSDGLCWSVGGRTQLEEVRSENGALQERLGVLQQEVHNLEDDVAKKRWESVSMPPEIQSMQYNHYYIKTSRDTNCSSHQNILYFCSAPSSLIRKRWEYFFFIIKSSLQTCR